MSVWPVVSRLVVLVLAGPVHGGARVCVVGVWVGPAPPGAARVLRGWGCGACVPICVVVCSAVSYSPTPWRVQYHRRWGS